MAGVCSVGYVAGSLGATAYSAGLIDLLWGNIQEAFSLGAPFVVTLENGGTQILTFLGIWTAAWAAYTVQVLVMASFAERLNLSLRNQIAEKLARLPLSYYDAHQPGDTISRATNDLDKISEVLQRGLLQLVIAVCMVGRRHRRHDYLRPDAHGRLRGVRAARLDCHQARLELHAQGRRGAPGFARRAHRSRRGGLQRSCRHQGIRSASGASSARRSSQPTEELAQAIGHALTS